MYKTEELLDLNHSLAGLYLKEYIYPFECLSKIKEFILEIGNKLDLNEYKKIKDDVWVHKSAKIFESVYLSGPCIIGANSEIRQCAFIRESALIGENCVVGNSCELKNCILFDNVQVPHFNYVGDSILGYKAHMGAGAVTSNVRGDHQEVILHDEKDIKTGLRKFGAILGDYVEVGCNAVLNPGTIVGRHSNIYPTSCVRGIVKENSIFKNNGEIVDKE